MRWPNINDEDRRLVRRTRHHGGQPAIRSPASGLFWRIFAGNGVIFAVGTTVLALSPATVSSPVLLTELPVLTGGLALMLALNAVVLRTSLTPLQELGALAERVNALRPGDRLIADRDGDLGRLISTLNATLDRLEAERTTGAALALAAQEAERRRIAQELHDEIGQSLTVALLELKRAKDHATPPLSEQLSAAQETVRSTLEEVRNVARRLRPGVLDDLGLPAALTALAGEFSKATGIPVHRRVRHALPALGGDIELVIYRIAQECLTNVARHAGAGAVALSLACDEESVTLAISDDGHGPPIHEGAGIHGMRERAMLVGGHLALRTAPAGGLEVRLTIPARARPEGTP